MALTSAPVGPDVLRGGRSRSATVLAPVLGGCLVGVVALVADALAGQARFALLGLAATALALALTLGQAARAHAGRPVRTSRLAARSAGTASGVVAAFLACVGVLERGGPAVTGSAAFAAGVALMSALLLVVLPLALLAFAWCVLRDPRLGSAVRVLPAGLLLVVAVAVGASAVLDGSSERWVQAVAAAAGGAVLAGLSAGLARAGSVR